MHSLQCIFLHRFPPPGTLTPFRSPRRSRTSSTSWSSSTSRKAWTLKVAGLQFPDLDYKDEKCLFNYAIFIFKI
jgi:hypothetical protein